MAETLQRLAIADIALCAVRYVTLDMTDVIGHTWRGSLTQIYGVTPMALGL